MVPKRFGVPERFGGVERSESAEADSPLIPEELPVPRIAAEVVEARVDLDIDEHRIADLEGALKLGNGPRASAKSGSTSSTAR